MTFEDLKRKYPDRDGAFPKGQPEPNREDLKDLTEVYNCKFPPSFIEYQLKYGFEVSMSDFAWTGFGWANKKLPPYLNLETVLADYKDLGYPEYLTPFRYDNGDFWCFDNRTQVDGEYPVVIWDHNSNDIEQDPNYHWDNFIDWLDKTMLDEY